MAYEAYVAFMACMVSMACVVYKAYVCSAAKGLLMNECMYESIIYAN